MNDSPTQKRPRGTRWCSIGIVAAAIGAVAVVVCLAGVRVGLIGAQTAFMAFAIGLLAFAVGLVSTGVGLLLSKGSAGAASKQRAWTALAAAVLFFAASFSQMPNMSGTAPINDISTDVRNPPAFVAIVPFREGAPVPPEYAGQETARQQAEAYPDIQTLMIERPTDEVLNEAEKVAQDLGWEIVAIDRIGGRIEATDTTFWFRFKDDVVIRLTPRGDETYVDIRSKSRVGRGDMGANASRIRRFLERLSEITST